MAISVSMPSLLVKSIIFSIDFALISFGRFPQLLNENISINAMTNPVYFDTYEDAEAYSKSIKPSLDKRQCGNCW